MGLLWARQDRRDDAQDAAVPETHRVAALSVVPTKTGPTADAASAGLVLTSEAPAGPRPSTQPMLDLGLIGLVYQPKRDNVCPGCGGRHWLLGRVTAECPTCGTALVIQRPIRFVRNWDIGPDAFMIV